jgi:hypothetical protein
MCGFTALAVTMAGAWLVTMTRMLGLTEPGGWHIMHRFKAFNKLALQGFANQAFNRKQLIAFIGADQ